MSKMIEQFLDYLALERNYSSCTVQAYSKDLKEFELYYKSLDNGSLTWQTVDADVIRDWMESMMDRGNTATSIGRRLSAVRSFYRFALKKGIVANDPSFTVMAPKKVKPLPVFLKEREMDALLDPKMWNGSYQDTLARTILIILYETGLRVSELTGLDDSAVDLINNEMKVTGKRDKQRIIPFGDGLATMLKSYMEQRDREVVRVSPALLVTKKGERMAYAQVRYLVRQNVARVSTLKKRSPHVLRHTFATAMLNNGAGLQSVEKLLGHESLSTTEIYTHTTFEQLKKVYSEAHPRG